MTGPFGATTRRFASATLGLEAFAAVFFGLAGFGLRLTSPGRIALIAGLLVVWALAAAGTLRRGRLGYALGTSLQLGMMACGFVLPAMWLLGAVFAAVWALGLYLGARLDARAADSASEAADAETTPPARGHEAADGETTPPAA